MAMFRYIGILTLITIFSHESFQQVPSTMCITCICEAASGCNLREGCINGICGMFHFTKPYWIDGGRLTLPGTNSGDESAWTACAQDTSCASSTVKNFLAKYAQDCNGNNEIDCTDFALIHHLGGFGCGSKVYDQRYLRRFENCYNAFRN